MVGMIVPSLVAGNGDFGEFMELFKRHVQPDGQKVDRISDLTVCALITCLDKKRERKMMKKAVRSDVTGSCP